MIPNKLLTKPLPRWCNLCCKYDAAPSVECYTPDRGVSGLTWRGVDPGDRGGE
jgi:hypothetical protein